MKPRILVIKRRGHIGQVTRDWEVYIKQFEMYLEIAKKTGNHNNPEKEGKPCQMCKSSKALME